jgi:hypothetical protein
MRRFPIKECVVKITSSGEGGKMVGWLVQTDADFRFETGERDEATVFVSPDAAIAAAETYLVEQDPHLEEARMEAAASGHQRPEVTYQVLRW